MYCSTYISDKQIISKTQKNTKISPTKLFTYLAHLLKKKIKLMSGVVDITICIEVNIFLWAQ